MGLFIQDDPTYDETKRMTGFNRYKQLLSNYAGHWTILNLITTMAATPLIIGIAASILYSSILMLLPLSILGGLILGPFVFALVDNLFRAFRDDPGLRWDNYKKGLRQNLSCSLLPGALLGLFTGVCCFLFYMMYEAVLPPTKGTIALFIFAIIVYIIFALLLTAQMVLFRQILLVRIRNVILFTAKYLWKLLLCVCLIGFWICLFFLLAPYSLVVFPFLGFWYILFLTYFILYEALDKEFHIEESIRMKHMPM